MGSTPVKATRKIRWRLMSSRKDILVTKLRSEVGKMIRANRSDQACVEVVRYHSRFQYFLNLVPYHRNPGEIQGLDCLPAGNFALAEQDRAPALDCTGFIRDIKRELPDNPSHRIFCTCVTILHKKVPVPLSEPALPQRNVAVGHVSSKRRCNVSSVSFAEF